MDLFRTCHGVQFFQPVFLLSQQPFQYSGTFADAGFLCERGSDHCGTDEDWPDWSDYGMVCDCVAARRTDRKGEKKLRSFFSALFYKMVNRISRIEIVEGARDFRMMSRRMADAVLQVKEYNRFSKGIFGWVGFRTEWLEYPNAERAAGQTKWSMKRLMQYSLDGILGFSTIPLSLSSYGGIVFCGGAFLFICFLMVRYLLWHDPVQGWTTLMCAIFFLGGVQLLCVGILGQYVSRAYMEIKKRPIYLLKESGDETDNGLTAEMADEMINGKKSVQ